MTLSVPSAVRVWTRVRDSDPERVFGGEREIKAWVQGLLPQERGWRGLTLLGELVLGVGEEGVGQTAVVHVVAEGGHKQANLVHLVTKVPDALKSA
jgi:hypothetical protein